MLSSTCLILHTNCHTLYIKVNKMKNPSFKSKNAFDFTWELHKALTLPWIRERYEKLIWILKWQQSENALCSQDSYLFVMLQISPLEIDQPQVTGQLVAVNAVWREFMVLGTARKRRLCLPRLRDALYADIFMWKTLSKACVQILWS